MGLEYECRNCDTCGYVLELHPHRSSDLEIHVRIIEKATDQPEVGLLGQFDVNEYEWHLKAG